MLKSSVKNKIVLRQKLVIYINTNKGVIHNEFKFPTEMVDLPSKGHFYVDGHPLSSGKVEVKYMTAKEEDILTSQNLIQQGTVIDVLLQSLIVDKTINVNELLIGDKNNHGRIIFVF